MARKKRKLSMTAPEYLVSILSRKRYMTKMEITIKMVRKGYAESSVPPAIAAARDAGASIVYAWSRGMYTLRAHPNEVNTWLRSRLKGVQSLLLRSQGVQKYARSLSKDILSKIDEDDQRLLRDYLKSLKSQTTHFKKVAGTY